MSVSYIRDEKLVVLILCCEPAIVLVKNLNEIQPDGQNILIVFIQGLIDSAWVETAMC